MPFSITLTPSNQKSTWVEDNTKLVASDPNQRMKKKNNPADCGSQFTHTCKITTDWLLFGILAHLQLNCFIFKGINISNYVNYSIKNIIIYSGSETRI